MSVGADAAQNGRSKRFLRLNNLMDH